MNNRKSILKTTAFILSLSLMLLLSACEQKSEPGEKASSEEAVTSSASEAPSESKTVNISGNSQGNYNNSGYVVCQGEDVFFVTRDGIYRTDIYGAKPTGVRACVGAYDLSLVGEWLYYKDPNYRKYCRINIETGAEEFVLADASNLRIYKNKLYYIDNTDDCFYSADLNGKNKKKLFDEYAYRVCVTNDKIYIGDNIDVYVYDLDGSNMVHYKDAGSQDMIIHEGYKYTSGNLDKENIDGSNSKILVDSGAMDIVIEGEWIYFIRYDSPIDDQKPGIYRIKTDGTELSQLYIGNVMSIYVVDDWIYFTTQKQLGGGSASIGKYIRMRTSGADFEELS